jgi:hypothetical protein
MKKIIKLTESQLVKLVNNVIKEINTENTYINNFKGSEKYKTKNVNVFGGSPTSEFIDYGIQFMPSGKGMYQVLFFKQMPDEFYSYVDQFEDDIKNEVLESLNKIYIDASGDFNRIHFREGVHPYLKGIGLGYIIYESFIKYLGYGSSSESATSDARKIWKKLLNDPDFHGIVCGDENQGGVLIFDKSYNKDVETIAKNFLSNKCGGGANIDDSLIKLYPNLNNT